MKPAKLFHAIVFVGATLTGCGDGDEPADEDAGALADASAAVDAGMSEDAGGEEDAFVAIL